MPHDVGIVLGHHYTGWSFTSRQKKRMEKALELLNTNQIVLIMTTGGKGMWKKSSPTMGEVASNYLQAHGVGPARLLVEDQSTSTLQNAQYALRLLEERGLTSAIVITSIDHLPRARRIFRDVFPPAYRLDFVVSDYFCGLWSVVDLLWGIAGNIKYMMWQVFQ